MTIFGTAEKKSDFCPRLIDYLVICGTRHPGQHQRNPSGEPSHGAFSTAALDSEPTSNTGSLHIVQNPDLLRRYPVADHKDFLLPSDVVYFCQPEGCITVGSKRQTFRDTSSFVFTLTEKDSAKIRYGICVNFYRTYEKRTSNAVAATSTNDDELNLSINGKSTLNTRPVRPKKLKKSHTLTSLCIISHHPFFTTFRQTLTYLRKLIDACNTRACAKKSGGNKLGR